MYILQVYIDGVRVELFKDENISFNQSIQNLKDISKVFIDFSQSFTVPASDINNPIFEHWYNADITGGFNAKVRKDAILELSFAPFKTGKMQLDGAKLKNGIPYAYKLTFFGDLLNLSDLFGDDKLSDLFLDAYDHDYTSANVLTGITTGLFFDSGSTTFGNIIYPLISSTRNWNWDSQGGDFAADDIKYPGSGTTGIDWRELKPAIKVNKLIEAIETDYSISFYGDFFKVKNNHIDALYMFMNKEKGQIQAYSDELSMFNAVQYFNATQQRENFRLKVTPGVGYTTVPYKITIRNSSDDSLVTEIDLVGETTSDMTSPDYTDYISLQFLGAGTYDIYISSILEFNFSFAQWVIQDQGTSAVLGSTTISNGNTTTATNMPDMTLIDFMSGLIKMFNLIIEPITSTTFNIKPLDEWYLDGTARDISKYVDITEVDINKPKLYKRIDFLYEETETVIGKNFFETNKRGFGDLKAEFTYDGGVLEVQLPFENIVNERLTSVNDSSDSFMHVGKLIEVNSEDGTDINAVDVKPFLFYNRNIVTLTSGFAFIDDAAAQSEVTRYQNVGQENELIRDDITESLNFGSEIGTWALQTPPVNPDSDGGLVYSLYSVYWEDYITDLYDSKRREYSYNAGFPLSVMKDIKMNDVLIIRDRLYTINQINTNLTTGKVKLNLLNYIGAPPEQEVSEAVGFDYVLDFEIN